MFKIQTIDNNNRMSTQDLLQAINEALAAGETEFRIEASGQHDIGGPLWHPVRSRLADIATLFVVGLTEASQQLGPHLTGLLSPFPLYALILAVFAHHFEGPAAAIRVLKGMLQGLFSFAVFFLIVAGLIEKAGTGPTLLLATELQRQISALLIPA